MRFTCSCGESTMVHKAYLPEEGETAPLVCSRCEKEWELYMSRGKLTFNEVEPDKVEPKRLRRRADAEAEDDPEADVISWNSSDVQ